MSKPGLRRLDWIRSVLNRLYNSALEERKVAWEKEEKSVTHERRCGLAQSRQASDLRGKVRVVGEQSSHVLSGDGQIAAQAKGISISGN